MRGNGEGGDEVNGDEGGDGELFGLNPASQPHAQAQAIGGNR